MPEEKKYNFLMWIVGLTFAAFMGFGSVQLISFGKMKNQLEDTIERINFISKDYVPMWYLEGIQINTNYQTQEIVATIKGDGAKVKDINEKYLEFQKIMLNNFIQMRGGITDVTRSINTLNPNNE
jgi:hypothetical protein